MPTIWLSVVLGFVIGSPAIAYAQTQSVPSFSYLPARDIEGFIVEKLDLSTFRNSFGPRRQPGMRFFSDFGLRPKTQANGTIAFEEEDWYYKITVLGRGDYNRDGVEDLLICFTDQALRGTYRTEIPLVVTRYSPQGLLIAIAYDVDHSSCGHR